MNAKISKFTLRVDPALLDKFRYIAEYNARSVNRELEILMRRHIEKYEQKHGPINPDQEEP